MIKTRSFLRKTKKGSILRVVREHYLRDDIPCNLAGCALCRAKPSQRDEGQIGGSDESSGTIQVLVPDLELLVHQMDVLEDASFRNIILLQTVFEELKRRSPPAFKKLLDLIAVRERQITVFPNEHHVETYVERKPAEAPADRNDRAMFTAIHWLRAHVVGPSPAKKKCHKQFTFTLLSENTEMHSKAEAEGIDWLTLKSTIGQLPGDHLALLDKIASFDGDQTPSTARTGSIMYPEYLPIGELSSGLREGRFMQGKFQISRENYLEGMVMVDGREQGIFVQGAMNLNRSVQGDNVVVQLLPEKEWSIPSAMLKLMELETEKDEGDEIDAAGDEEVKRAVPKSVPASQLLPTGKVVGIVRRNWRPFCGMLMKNAVPKSTRFLFIPADRRAPKIRIETRQAELLSTQRIIVSIDSWPRHSRYPLGHFVRSLGEVGDRATENEVLLIEHDVPHHTFSKAVLDCLPKLPWIITDKDEEARTDLRHIDVCSVDPPGCTDIDDALHCVRLPDGNIQAGVHIADVSHFVRPATAIDHEAASRGTTVYLVDQRIDMLPDLLSSNLCSLRGEEERFAFSCIWTLTDDGEILTTKFCKSIIRSRAALTYGEAQCRIDDSSQTDNIAKSLRLLNQLAKRLKKKRHSGGALSLASMEIRFNIDSETHDPINVQAKQALETNSMVEEFMLLANISVAKRIYEEFPDCALLRRHPVPPASNYEPIVKAAALRGFKVTIDSGKALSESLDKAVIPGNPYFNTMLRVLCTRCMTQAVYFASGTIEQPLFLHFGLASPIYTHFTSPIRRYADLVVHRLLGAAIGADRTYPDLLDKKIASKVCQNLNYRHKNAQLAGRASVLLNTHLFFRNRIEELEGYIISIRQNAFQVLIPKYGLESAVLLGQTQALQFDETDISLQSADNSVTLKMFDPVTVQISVDTKDVQHQKLKLELVKPVIPGFSVESVMGLDEGEAGSGAEREGAPAAKKTKLN